MKEWSSNTPRTIRARLLHPRAKASHDTAEAAPVCMEVGHHTPPLVPAEEPVSPTFFSHRGSGRVTDLDGHPITNEAGAPLLVQEPAGTPKAAMRGACAEMEHLSAKANKHPAMRGGAAGAGQRRMHGINQPTGHLRAMH